MSRIPTPSSRRALKPPTAVGTTTSMSSSFLNAHPALGRSARSASFASSRGSVNNNGSDGADKPRTSLIHRPAKERLNNQSLHMQPEPQQSPQRSPQRTPPRASLPSSRVARVDPPLPMSEPVTSLPLMPTAVTDNIRVVLRIRPPPSDADDDMENYDHRDEDNQSVGSMGTGRQCLDVSADGTSVTLAPASQQAKRFSFDRVFPPSCSQEDLFQDSGLMAVESALNGFNGCIFAYGQTGSGKTFTMLGGTAHDDAHALKVSPLRGLMPRLFDHLFRRLDDRVADETSDLEYSLSCSYLEIYNEKVFDLFEVDVGAAQRPKSVREDSVRKTVYVDQLRQIPITNAQDAIQWLQVGSRNRRMASTDMNRESSRSHAVFTLQLVQTHHTERGALITRRSNLHLVDLAGSEKQRQTKAAGQRLKEAAQINKSLSALGNVIMALVDVSNGLKRHVHYRDSKLTFLLRDSLGGNSVTTIIATISAEERFFTETLSTLKFAQRAKFIKNKAVQNEDSDSMIPLLRQEIERLQIEIASLKLSGTGTTSPNMALNASGQVSTNNQAINRWEPALEIMERLLSASGAAGVDTNGWALGDVSGYPAVIETLELRCQRLEMLLYRMICRYEEHKVMTLNASRARPQLPSGITRAPSLLRQPKIRYKGGSNKNNSHSQSDDNQSHESTSALEQEVADQHNRNAELESENELLRQQLSEFLEWKGMIMDRRRGNNLSSTQPVDGMGFGNRAIPGTMSEAMEEQRERNEELLQALNAYRSLFSDIYGMVDDEKRGSPVPSRNRTRTASVSTTLTEENSISGTSVDDCDSVMSGDLRGSRYDDDGDEDEDSDVFGTEREIRRMRLLSNKLDRKMERYNDTILQSQRDLAAVQDELETATAAAKFAEFQLEQLRAVAANHETIDREMGSLRADLRRSKDKSSFLQSQVDENQRMLEEALIQLEGAINQRDGAKAQIQKERKNFDDKLTAAEQSFDEQRFSLIEQIGQLQEQLIMAASDFDNGSDSVIPILQSLSTTGSDQADGDTDSSLRAAAHRIRELESELKRVHQSPRSQLGLESDNMDAPIGISVKMVEQIDGQDAGQAKHHPQLQKVLQDVLADNAKLIKTTGELQTEKRTREKEHMKEMERVREDNEELRHQLSELRALALTSSVDYALESSAISTTDTDPESLRAETPDAATARRGEAEAKQKVRRLRGERQALRIQLHQAQQKMRKLEQELSRSQRSQASREGFAPGMFCEM